MRSRFQQGLYSPVRLVCVEQVYNTSSEQTGLVQSKCANACTFTSAQVLPRLTLSHPHPAPPHPVPPPLKIIQARQENKIISKKCFIINKEIPVLPHPIPPPSRPTAPQSRFTALLPSSLCCCHIYERHWQPKPYCMGGQQLSQGLHHSACSVRSHCCIALHYLFWFLVLGRLEAPFPCSGMVVMQGQTALHWAARRGYATVVKELLSHGADVHALDCEVSYSPKTLPVTPPEVPDPTPSLPPRETPPEPPQNPLNPDPPPCPAESALTASHASSIEPSRRLIWPRCLACLPLQSKHRNPLQGY